MHTIQRVISDHLGLDFLNFVYDVIESPPDDDETITDIFANVVFALNLQFPKVDDNLTINALAERSNAKVFTQKIIYYLNREGKQSNNFSSKAFSNFF